MADPGTMNSSTNHLVLTMMGVENGTVVNNNGEEKKECDITYGVDDNPPWYLCIFMALQHYLTMIGAIVSIPFILTPALCMKDDDPARGHIICTMIFVTGLVTWFQCTFGCRMPIVQGGTISFLVPTLAILNLPQWQCPPQQELEAMSPENRTELWQVRMRELSGAIAVSAILQAAIGLLGIVGVLLKYVTPLTIVPTVSLVGLSLFEDAAEAASQHWGIAAGTILLLTTFSQVLREVNVPVLGYRKGHGFTVVWFQLFKLFPVLLTIMIMWGICGALTLSGSLPEGHPARTDVKLRIIEDSPWFRFPYPAAPPPPVHAINRGIAIEGIGTILAGIWGSGNGTNTFGENVGAIGVTKASRKKQLATKQLVQVKKCAGAVCAAEENKPGGGEGGGIGSRRVIQYAALLMVIQGLVSKFGAVFIIIPQPVVGGMFCVMFGMIAAFGLSALQYVDLNSSRNLYIIGFSIFFAMVLPKWMQAHPHAIQTGNEVADSIITVLLSTSILVGGAIGCLCDNLIPGTPEERGLVEWQKQMKLEGGQDDEDNNDAPSTYDFPVGMGFVKR
ncbi:Solute carrier family 23 member 1 [Blattella germanica]|nr:Solute carrier family 23 member 1 [Blattella germanica]